MPIAVPTLEIESQLWQQGLLRVAGVDEVGLGCLAGPIVAAAVIMPPQAPVITGVRDSKTLSAAQRQRLLAAIQAQAIAIGVGMASVTEIEQINVLQASYRAMGRALDRVAPWNHALIDGRSIPVDLGGTVTTLIKGDRLSYVIACASIVAKVRRDRLMERLARRYPGYGWERNAGYGTAEHRAALTQLGITPWHRKSYAPVQQAIEQLSLF
ncbi:MAG: ribonuclease HII [Synechococcales bacterium]|nr:ribonuclease HII [Synechococcales bacterium]